MSKRLAFLSLLLLNSGCVFISEPDIGASDHFDFEPEESLGSEPQRGTDNEVLSGSSPTASDCLTDAGVRCEGEDSGTSQESGDADSGVSPQYAIDGSRDGLTPQPRDFDPNDTTDDNTDDAAEEEEEEEEAEDEEEAEAEAEEASED